MNKKTKRIITWLAAAFFLFALVINVKVTLDDPIILSNDMALATNSTITYCSSDYEFDGELTSLYCNGNWHPYGTTYVTATCHLGDTGECDWGEWLEYWDGCSDYPERGYGYHHIVCPY